MLGSDVGSRLHSAAVEIKTQTLPVQVLKVQIRQDLVLDISAVPADRSLLALAPQASTPVLPVARPTTKPTPPSLLEPRLFPCSLLEINNKNIIFPITPAGEASGREVKYYIFGTFHGNVNCMKSCSKDVTCIYPITSSV